MGLRRGVSCDQTDHYWQSLRGEDTEWDQFSMSPSLETVVPGYSCRKKGPEERSMERREWQDEGIVQVYSLPYTP